MSIARGLALIGVVDLLYLLAVATSGLSIAGYAITTGLFFVTTLTGLVYYVHRTA